MNRNRQTKIVATVGPACATVDRLRLLHEAGADVFRFNFSHGNHEEHAARLGMVRAVEAQCGQPIGVFADLQGPKLRVGRFADGKVAVASGDAFRLDLDPAPGDRRRAPLPHPEIFSVLKPGADVLLDDGRVRLAVTSVGAEFADTKVVVGGVLSDHKGVNLPDVLLKTSPLTAKDRRDLAFALDQGVNLIALSFVQREEDVAEAKEVIDGRAKLIVKLEKPSAILHLDRIIELADALMVARGDLGVEVPSEDVPALQKRILRSCRAAGKPAIVATQMLESMMNVPRPTRAEASDVATAVYDGADAVMLSGETAAGSYPVEAVEMMDRIIRRTERDPVYRTSIDAAFVMPETTDADAISAAARTVARTVGASAILTFTSSGATTLRVARERPLVPILALTPSDSVLHTLTLTWGVRPVLVPPIQQFEQLIDRAVACARREGFCQANDRLVITAGLPLETPGTTNALHIVQASHVAG